MGAAARGESRAEKQRGAGMRSWTAPLAAALIKSSVLSYMMEV